MRLVSIHPYIPLIAFIIFVIILTSTQGIKEKGFYDLFGLDPSNFSESELRKAYYKLAKKWHPDKNPGNEQAHKKFTELTEAFECLNDPKKKKLYDDFGKEGLKHGGNGGGFQDAQDIFDKFFGGGGGGGFHFGGGHFHFGGSHGHHRNGPARGPSAQMEAQVSLKDAYSGATLEAQITRQQKCPSCKGIGASNPSDVTTCDSCAGRGVKITRQQLGMGIIQQVQSTCDACGGRGKIFKNICTNCRGSKVLRAADSLNIPIEKGTPDGFQVKFEGRADEIPDGEAGDLYVIIRVLDHFGAFHREGDNLYMDYPLTLSEALFGFSKKLKHIDDHIFTVVRNSVTQPGFVQEIKGEGMPLHQNASKKGSLFVKYNLTLPTNLSTKQLRILKDILQNERDEL